MMEIRKFKAENNEHNRTYYAVTGAKNNIEATLAVIKYKKTSVEKLGEFHAMSGVIDSYNDVLDGIWKRGFHEGGTPCFIVWR